VNATVIGSALALVSFVGGVYFGLWWSIHTCYAMQIKHQEQMDEIYDEVTRLRAQNAMLIGKE
jgi:hypothetical protein